MVEALRWRRFRIQTTQLFCYINVCCSAIAAPADFHSTNSNRNRLLLLTSMITSESTTFTLDNQGRFTCNTLQEARDSAAQTVAGRRRDSDVIKKTLLKSTKQTRKINYASSTINPWSSASRHPADSIHPRCSRSLPMQRSQ